MLVTDSRFGRGGSQMPETYADDVDKDDSHQYRRRTLHRSSLVHVEDAWFSPNADPISDYENDFHVCVTYDGAFAYDLAEKRWIIDASRTLFISPGRHFSWQHLTAGVGHAAILLHPSRELLDEVCGRPGPDNHNAFADISRPATMRLRLLTQFIRNAHGNDDPLAKDEWAIHTLREAAHAPTAGDSRQSRIVERAKELLHARAGKRLSLAEIAKNVGVSPVYLTQEFARSEGTPLYRYQLNLRLTRALLALEHCDDITGLALDLGFSSHSHFTAEFRKAFGLTPSRYRGAIASKQARVGDLLNGYAVDKVLALAVGY